MTATSLLPVRLDRTARVAVEAPVLDDQQRRVVGHRGGPMLVLAGPGTGKTTTLVESIVSALTRSTDPLGPNQILGLTFGRRAAHELRERVTARIGGGLVPIVSTFHSFCYSLVRSFGDASDFARPLRLMTGPEQDLHVRELINGSVDLARIAWPESLRPALGTRGFSEEVRSLIARARSLQLDPDDLMALGKSQGDPAWTAVGEFLGEYLDVLDAEGVLDYTELLHRAVTLAETPEVRARLHLTYRAIYVDEYQDTDHLQVRLLRAIAASDATVVAVGDPDQAIYSFRGADVKGISQFREQFSRNGSEVPLVVLERTRRFGPVIRTAASAILGSRVPTGFAADEIRRHRGPTCDKNNHGEGRVDVLAFDSVGAQADHIAELLRRARAESTQAYESGKDQREPLSWSDMAVLVRSGVRDIGPIVRSLIAAGIPAEVAGDEMPLHREPAVAPLLTVLRLVVEDAALTPDCVHDLLLSPLIQADPGGLRRLGRSLRRLDREGAFDLDGPASGPRPRPSAELIREAVRDVEFLALVDPDQVGSAVPSIEALHRLIQDAHQLVLDGGTPEEVLWSIWSGTSWPTRLERAALRGGAWGRRADHDLDAVCALFAAAADVTARAGRGKGVAAFLAELEGQWIPAQSQQEHRTRGEAVRVLTAHRSKGLQWPLVVVAGVQEESWPDTRRRGSLLSVDRLGSDGVIPPVSVAELVAEERRLFYVACTRAQRRLIVTSVDTVKDDGPQPSRFVADLGIETTRVVGRPERALSPASLVARLRCAAVDPDVSAALREAAVDRLAALASVQDAAGHLLVPAADPDRWWGAKAFTVSDIPVRPIDAPVRLSGSGIEGLHTCALRWFLSHEVRGETPSTTALGFGSVIHVLADQVSRGHLERDAAVIEGAIDEIWPRMPYDAPWESEQQRDEAVSAARRFLAFDEKRAREGFTRAATEARFDLELDVRRPDGQDERVRLTGSMDRVDVDDSERVVVSDYKTSKNKPSADEVTSHRQLGVYQLAVREGALDGYSGLEALGGASLVQLRSEAAKAPGLPIEQTQDPLTPRDADDPQQRTWIDEALGVAAALVRDEVFEARPDEATCKYCEFRRLCPAWPRGQEVV